MPVKWNVCSVLNYNGMDSLLLIQENHQISMWMGCSYFFAII